MHPNHDVGYEQSRFPDFFWNKERISRLMWEEDVVIVAIGFRYLEYFIKNKASD